MERSKPICDRNGHLTSTAAHLGVESSTALIWLEAPCLGAAQEAGSDLRNTKTQSERWFSGSRVDIMIVVHHQDWQDVGDLPERENAHNKTHLSNKSFQRKWSR